MLARRAYAHERLERRYLHRRAGPPAVGGHRVHPELIGHHRDQETPRRVEAAAYEVVDETSAAFGLAIANTAYGTGRLPQVVVPSYETSLRFVLDFPIEP